MCVNVYVYDVFVCVCMNVCVFYMYVSACECVCVCAPVHAFMETTEGFGVSCSIPLPLFLRYRAFTEA